MAKYQAYTEYKDSNNKWLAELPAHWKLVALKHVLVMPMTDGPHETPEFIDEGVPFVSAEAVSSGQIDFNKIRGFISEADDIRFSKKYKPQLHDVYMIKSGATTGITAIVETDQHFNIWSPLAAMRCKQIYEPYFLLNYLRSDPFQKSVQLSWTFGTQQNIGMATLENLPVCFPPKEEQKKIAEFLNYETTKIDHLIEKQQQLIELLKEKRQAVISHAVTKGLDPNVPMKDSGVAWLGEVPEHWAVSKLSYVAHGFNGDRGSNYPSGQDFVDEGIPFISSSELIHSKVDPVYASKITKEKYNSLGGLKIKVGDIIYCLRGSVGKNGLCEFNEGTIASSLMGIRCFSLSPYYLLLLLNSTVEFQQRSNFTTGSVSANLSAENVMSYKFALPPIKEQIEIANNLKKVFEKYDKLILKAESAIQLMQERRTALISAAVTGKIDVRHWQAPNVTEADMELSA